jgi:hypothetical protein
VVWMPDREIEVVVEQEVAPRSYNVSTPGGTLRRSLIQVPEGPGNWEMEPHQINGTESDQNRQYVEVLECLVRWSDLTQGGRNCEQI